MPGAAAAATISRLSACGQTLRRTLFLVSIIPLVDTIPVTPTLSDQESAVGCYRLTRRPSAEGYAQGFLNFGKSTAWSQSPSDHQQRSLPVNRRSSAIDAINVNSASKMKTRLNSAYLHGVKHSLLSYSRRKLCREGVF